ncbi:MAG: DUF4350 domain-containing protein [Nannocystales bacterium]
MRTTLGIVAATLFLLAPSSVSAAEWGSYGPARMAYPAGALSGTAHDDLRAAIEAAGDGVAAPTDALTAEYLDGVDVFYTGMLSGGTGPMAGELGTLSNPESDALESWIGAGGTLVVTVDSTGLPGDMFATVYESWGALFGMDTVAFVTNEGMAAPAGVHPLTAGVAQYSWVNHTTFELGDDAQVLGDSAAGETFLAVLEPSSGFAAGGRVVVIGDHNFFTDNFIATADNAVLAANLIQWAAGECGNDILEEDEACDDGNVDDDDGCSAACEVEAGGGTSSTGGSSTETGDDTSTSGDGGDASSSGPGRPGSTGSTGAETSSTGSETTSGGGSTTDPAPGTTSQGTSSTGGTGDTDGGGGASSGSGCTQGGPVRSGWALALLLLGMRRRRPRSH